MLRGLKAPGSVSSRHCSLPQTSGKLRHRSSTCRPAVERDLDWEPEVAKGPLLAPPRFRPPPPPPPPRRSSPSWLEAPFSSRRNILASVIAGMGGLYVANNRFGPLQFGDRPDVPFDLVGYTDLDADEFAYFKTPAGNWVAAAKDERNRLFMIDQIGDLYYDSGDPQVGLYAMDTQGNLFNFYMDTDGERKITPVGNVRDLRKFKISNIAGVKLDSEVPMVAFEDGREIPLPPQSGRYDKNGKFIPPGEIVEGFTQRARDVDNPFSRMFNAGGGESGNAVGSYRPERLEVDMGDLTPLDRQMFSQTMLDDPTQPGYQPALPKGFDINLLASEVEEEARTGRRN